MNGIKHWFLSQLVSPPSLISSRHISGGRETLFDEEPTGEESNRQEHPASSVATQPEFSDSTRNPQNQLPSSSQQGYFDDSNSYSHLMVGQRSDPLDKIEALKINFLRVLRRLEHSHDNLVVSKVLYRLHLATLIRSGKSEAPRPNLEDDRAREIAEEQEASGAPELDFSMRILVLGKTGIGKSATINSIFNQVRARTDAFLPATDRIQELVGTVNGIRINVIDTPGLLPTSMSTLKRNRKILFSIKRFIRRAPPDIVLYFERMDILGTDVPLLRLIADVLGSAIWFNAVLVMTHSSSDLFEGSYDSCKVCVQRSVQQSVSDSRLENPVLLVENHPECRTNFKGDKILLNGEAWKSRFLVLCACAKVLGDANTFLEFQNGFELGPPVAHRSPSLPHLLSSFLERRPLERTSKDGDLSTQEDPYEYDSLPPIRILTKTQFQNLTDSQKRDYLHEIDLRETLYLKKQLKEETLRGEIQFQSPELQSPEPLPDMALPLSFDSDCSVHRYRSLVASNQWVARPVLDPHGWDHDVGFEGISLEGTSQVLATNVLASFAGQASKDKHDLSFQSECTARGPNYCLGLSTQSSGKDSIFTLDCMAQHKSFKDNITSCGLCVSSFGEKRYYGLKLEDAVLIGRRVELMGTLGRLVGCEERVYGGSLDVVIRGRDFAVREDGGASLGLTGVLYGEEAVVGGRFETKVRTIWGTGIGVNVKINSRRMGEICVRVSRVEHLGIALVGIVSIVRYLFFRRKRLNGMLRTEMVEEKC